MAQAQQLTLTSRAFFNDKLGPAEKQLCELFGYDKWDGVHGGITLEEDKNSDGTIDATTDEADEA